MTDQPPLGLSFTLPLPPSVNQQYVMHEGKRVLSPASRRYKQQALARLAAMIGDERCPANTLALLRRAHWGIYADFYFETPTRRDLDNGFKIAQDVVATAFGLNDNRVVDIHLTKRIDPLHPRVEITVEAILDWQFDEEHPVLHEAGTTS